MTTFTDCVNCLIAFTNNRHNRTKDGLTVSLNAIAFLRFCAMKLATGAIGDVETFPEGHPQTPTSQVCISPSAVYDQAGAWSACCSQA